MASCFCRVFSDTGKCREMPTLLAPWFVQKGQCQGVTGRSVNLRYLKDEYAHNLFMAIFVFKGF